MKNQMIKQARMLSKELMRSSIKEVQHICEAQYIFGHD